MCKAIMFELRVRVGRKLIFSHIGTLEQCHEWIEYWSGIPSCRYYERTYTLHPKESGTLQD